MVKRSSTSGKPVEKPVIPVPHAMSLGELMRYVRDEYPSEDLRRAFLAGYVRGRLQVDVQEGRGYLDWPHIEESGEIAAAGGGAPTWRKAAALWFLRLRRRFPGAGARELTGFICDELRREGLTRRNEAGEETPHWRTVMNHLYDVARQEPQDR